MNLEKDLQREMAESMLKDVISSNAYDHLITDYKKLFKDKIVLDVGCRSGLLSLMSVEVGAVKVIAVGNMYSAGLVKKALAQGDKEDIFEAVKGAIQDIRLPCGLKYVDIIVSEWLGHSVFVDSLFREVIFAREKWLAKGGIIIPNVAQLYVSGISEHRRPIVQVNVPDFLFQPFRKPKRVRTAFSPTQLLKLEHAFEGNHYVVGAERKQLAQGLSLTETQVKVWFQNRRTKHKRMQQEGDGSDTKSNKGSSSGAGGAGDGEDDGKHDGSGSQHSYEDAEDPEEDDEIEEDDDEDEVIDMDDYGSEIDAEEHQRLREQFQQQLAQHQQQFLHQGGGAASPTALSPQQQLMHQQHQQQHFLQQQQHLYLRELGRERERDRDRDREREREQQ